ncbi:hypothetical protein CI238_13469, partial [Colletotrichum incanum]
LAICIPGEEVIFALHDDIRRQCPAIRTYTLNDRNPFAITRLFRTRPSTAVRGCNNLCVRQHSHQEPSLVKIIDIAIEYTVFRNCISRFHVENAFLIVVGVVRSSLPIVVRHASRRVRQEGNQPYLVRRQVVVEILDRLGR